MLFPPHLQVDGNPATAGPESACQQGLGSQGGLRRPGWARRDVGIGMKTQRRKEKLNTKVEIINKHTSAEEQTADSLRGKNLMELISQVSQ